jgi:hypothetical protein
MKKVYAGILHDTYTDENGKEVAYSQIIAGTWKGNSFCAVDFPDRCSWDMSREDFENKVTNVCVIPTLENKKNKNITNKKA